MKKIILLFALITIVMTGFPQVKLDYAARPKTEAMGFSARGLSPSSARLLYQLRMAETAVSRSAKESMYAQLHRDYSIVQGKIAVTLVLEAGRTPQDLTAYGVTVGSVVGEMVTATIPVDRFAELAQSGLCSTIDAGHKQHLMMDNVRENLGIDQIHAGMHLPQGYDGSGVVVGVIDIGFEFCHPAFYDVAGNTLRVKRVWNQKDSTGTAPDGYSYGSEYTTEAQMMAARTDNMAQSHGSHVTSIAAGCGASYGDGAAYRGIAPGADIVMVPVILENPNIIDAINYIHSYAQSVGKPCVINMSFGSVIGPHDGTGVGDRMISSIAAQYPDSLVFVASAGNYGSDQVHLEKQFSQEDTVLVTRLEYELLQIDEGEVDVWGDKNFSVALSLVKTSPAEQVDFTGFFTTGADTSIVANLLTDDNDTLVCQFKLFQKDSINHRYNANIVIGSIPFEHELILTVRCDTVATIHAWCEKVLFHSTELVDGTVDGDSLYAISGFGANTESVISVGSYNTRLSCTTYNGYFQSSSSRMEMGDISYFSSHGPTFDGRVKPDIAAPGCMIVAACNRFDNSYSSSSVYDTISWNGQTEEFHFMQGTSMSAPMVTGVVALWMQHNPSLGVDSARAILHGTARNDRYTGSCVSEPNNRWGHGKVNAFGGLPVDETLWLLNAFEAEDGTGCVDGGGVVVEGLHTLTAVPAANHVFVSWDDGNTENPRTVNVACDTTFLAVFSQLSYEDCDTIADFPWTAEFDENFTCWKLIDADGDGSVWSKTMAAVSSLATGMEASNLDNWLVSPAILVHQHLNAKVSTRCMSPSGSQDCSLLLSTSGSEIADFTTELVTHTYTLMQEEKELSASLDAFQGQTVRIAVRHHNCTSMLASMMLDDFTIEVVEDTVSVPSYAETYSYSVSTQGLRITIGGAEGHSLQIYDLTGRLVVKSEVANGSYTLPSAGMYIVRVSGLKPRKVMAVR